MYYVHAVGVEGYCELTLDDGYMIPIIFVNPIRAFTYAQHFAKTHGMDYEVRTWKKDKLMAIAYRDGSFFKTPKYLKKVGQTA